MYKVGGTTEVDNLTCIEDDEGGPQTVKQAMMVVRHSVKPVGRHRMGVLESTQRDNVKRLADFPDSEVESTGKAMGDLELNTRQEATERGCSSVDFNPEKVTIYTGLKVDTAVLSPFSNQQGVKISNTYGTKELSNSSTRAQDSPDRVRKY